MTVRDLKGIAHSDEVTKNYHQLCSSPFNLFQLIVLVLEQDRSVFLALINQLHKYLPRTPSNSRQTTNW